MSLSQDPVAIIIQILDKIIHSKKLLKDFRSSVKCGHHWMPGQLQKGLNLCSVDIAITSPY